MKDDIGTGAAIAVFALWAMWILVSFGAGIGITWAAIHFILKFW